MFPLIPLSDRDNLLAFSVFGISSLKEKKKLNFLPSKRNAKDFSTLTKHPNGLEI